MTTEYELVGFERVAPEGRMAHVATVGNLQMAQVPQAVEEMKANTAVDRIEVRTTGDTPVVAAAFVRKPGKVHASQWLAYYRG